MFLKHNLSLNDEIPVREEVSRIYNLSAQPLRTYADIIKKKHQPLINKILQAFPGSRVLSEEEKTTLLRRQHSGCEKPKRSGRETAKANFFDAEQSSDHPIRSRSQGNIKSKDKKRRVAKNRWISEGQMSLDLSSDSGGTV